MVHLQSYIFVLWAEQFEEVVAAIFVTELRRAGLRVKVVGLSPRPICGCHGLALVPDLSLDQALALATQVVCLIIPQGAGGLNPLNYEPRLGKLFEQAGQNGASIVTGSADQLTVKGSRILVYSQYEDLVGYVRKLAGVLQGSNQHASDQIVEGVNS